MQKALVKIIFVRKMFICELIFKNFEVLLKSFGMQKDGKIILSVGVLEHGDMQKGSFQMIV